MVIPPTSAGLLHVISWNHSEPTFQIERDIYASKMEGSEVERLYINMCTNEKFDSDYDPLEYPTCFISKNDDTSLYGIEPINKIVRLCTLFSIHAGSIIPMCRIIGTSDNFSTYLYSYMLFEYQPQSDFLFEDDKLEINLNILESIKNSWEIIKKKEDDRNKYRRVFIALDNFYYSQRAIYLEQTAIHIAIAMEALFTPSSNTELSHQTSFNLAAFIGSTRDEKREIYENVKKFYNLRSGIIHGGIADEEKIAELTPLVFKYIAHSLSKVISNENMLEDICSEKIRKEMFMRLLF